MGDRPTHAATVRPVFIELPLWAVWRVGRHAVQTFDAVVGVIAEWVHAYRHAYRDTDPHQWRLVVLTAWLTNLMFACGVLAAALI